MVSSAGTPRARTLAAMLRDAVENSSVSARQLAKQLGIAHTTVGRWISGTTVPNVENVAAALAVLGVTGEARERILAVARDTGQDDWLVSGPPGISEQLAGVMQCERTAIRIVAWQPHVVPGLLQTSDYARTIISAGDLLPAAEVETRLVMRLARRDAVTRADPVQLDALIGEPAILGRVGGPKVMANQLRHLLATSALDNVTLRLVSMAGDWHPGHAGPFTLYEFDGDLPAIVYLEHHRSGVFLVDEQDVAAYKDAAERIRRAAMSPDESAGLIADVVPDYGEDANDRTPQG